MEERVWNLVYYWKKDQKGIFKLNHRLQLVCELEHDTLLRQRKLLPSYRKCDLEIDNQRWLATEQKKIQPGALWWQNLRFPAKEWKSRPTWSKAKQNYWFLYQVQVGCKAKYRENKRRVTPSTHEIFSFSLTRPNQATTNHVQVVSQHYSVLHMQNILDLTSSIIPFLQNK